MDANGIVRFLQDDQGLEMVEWAVVGTAIVVAAAFAFFPVGAAVSGGINALADVVTSGS
jgi:Flp pilus assembly pilin Flp